MALRNGPEGLGFDSPKRRPPISHAPKIPAEQTSFADKGDKSVDEAKMDRRDQRTDAQSGQPGDADVNTDEQGRFGDIKQNTTHQGHQQDR